ncbi:NTP transferase domain-containing protein [Pseudomaricurvus sp. HS19]|uniref:nucleotidyltransferase family protein n=1 Tax=Pseudomaricurvus sp. HS19 TaxID=2692626 RepID=UPI00136E0597|nr:nucleotidyltransferase family protein [Pseudomaricurvus sp. HS19]MYM62617.1 NTP transferase domain-containing protein [Pseudomaricurvus sp. HS19]
MEGELQVLLLAAGQGSRFGGDKLLAPMADGRPVLQHTCERLQQAGLTPLCLVRAQDYPLQALLERLGIEWRAVTADGRAQPMSVSLQEGVKASADADGWMIVLGDMPFVAVETYRRLQQSYWQQRQSRGEDAPLIVRPFFQPGETPAAMQPGHPVIFSRQFMWSLRQLTGDEGGRSVIHAYPQALYRLAVTDAGVLRDVDQPADLQGGEQR